MRPVTTLPANQRASLSSVLRARGNTAANLPAEMVLTTVAAGVDLVALGYLATSRSIRFSNLSEPTARRPSVDIRVEGTSWNVWPPYAALSVVREDVLKVRSLSYQNPIDILTLGKFSRPVAQAIVSFTDAFRLGKARKQLLTEQAARENIRRVIEDATIELSVQEKFLHAQELQLNIELKREQVRAQRLENIQRTMDLAQRIRDAQEAAHGSHPTVPIWGELEASAIADNVRLLASIDLADRADFTVQLADDDDTAPDARR